jgi:hypothetical protein
MNLFNFFIISVLIVQSCNKREDNVRNEKLAEYYKYGMLRYAVIEDIQQIDLQGLKTWHPNVFTVMNFEQLIKQAIVVETKGYRGRAIDLDLYYRQYVCYINPNGDSIVYVNAFCSLHNNYITDSKGGFREVPFDWSHKLLKAMDGGSCFWGVTINISKKRWSDFHINGEA